MSSQKKVESIVESKDEIEESEVEEPSFSKNEQNRSKVIRSKSNIFRSKSKKKDYLEAFIPSHNIRRERLFKRKDRSYDFREGPSLESITL